MIWFVRVQMACRGAAGPVWFLAGAAADRSGHSIRDGGTGPAPMFLLQEEELCRTPKQRPSEWRLPRYASG